MIERFGIPGFLRAAVAGAMGGSLGSGGSGGEAQAAEGTQAGTFQLPDLPYASDALEPYIDEQTMRIHHGKHHAGYVANLKKALEGRTGYRPKNIEEVCTSLTRIPDAIRMAVRNNAGGHYNHSLFWTLMAPAGNGGGGEPTGDLLKAIKTDLGGFAAFKEAFTKAAMARFGSGWTWLCVGADQKLCIYSTPNQDNPLMTGVVDSLGAPVLGLDVWEHAYYLKYQNRRPDYIEAWWHVVDWQAVADRYTKIRG
jgi:Fe-Mn family superoxide dismutase